MRQRRGQYWFALAVGLAVAVFSYRWITNPEPRLERVTQENVVLAARQHLLATIDQGDLEMVDPLAPMRKVGKVYVYREGSGWAVSGYYRRSETDKWHPYLVNLGSGLELSRLKVGDPAFVERAKNDPLLDASP